MIDDKIYKALEQMKFDINNTMLDFNNDTETDGHSKYKYFISIYSRNRQGLVYAFKLLTSLNIRVRNILLTTESYKRCNFDCIIVTDIFRSIKFLGDCNAESITIIERTDIDDDDFHVSILKKNNDGSNDIMLYSLFKTINR